MRVKEYKAVSNYYVLSPFKRKEDLYANVYIDKDNPDKYSVELFSNRLIIQASLKNHIYLSKTAVVRTPIPTTAVFIYAFFSG